MNGPHPTDEAEPRLAVAHRADEIALRLRHATERLAAAAASEPGPERQGNVAALRSNLDEALEHAHRLVGLMTEHYPAEGAEYGKLVGAMGLRSASPAPEATFAHLAQTVLYQLAHASRHADSMTDNPDIFDFDAEHCQHHLDGALEHVGKFEQNLMDGHYPAEAGWLAGLQPAAVPAAEGRARVTEWRTFTTALEVREGGRTICGLAVPFRQPTWVHTAEYGRMAEDFAPGSVDCSRPVELLAGHPEGLRLPVATGRLAEERGGVYGAWPVDPTGLGDHVLAMVRAGKAGGLSVGFHPLPGGDVVDQQNRRLTRLRVELDHVALTEPGMAAYPDAKVLAVRAGKEYGTKFSEDEHRLRPEAASLLVEVCRRSADGELVTEGAFGGIRDPQLARRVLDLQFRSADGPAEDGGAGLWDTEAIEETRRFWAEQRRRVAATYAKPL